MQFAHNAPLRSTSNAPARRWVAVVSMLAAAAFIGSLLPGTAQAGKSTQTQAVWVSFDPEAATVTVKVKKAGSGKDAKRLKRGKKATFNVKIGGSVLTKTTVSVNGKRGELDEIPEGKTVNIYWRPDEKDDTKMFARKIDVIFSDAELEERWKAVD
jgi:hypothetical protein